VKPQDTTSGGGAHLDALLPPEMAARAEEVGARKAAMDTASTFTLAVLAGAFIALGGVFATTALAGAGTAPWGAIRVLGGVAFSLGLVLVMVGGAELFTGNNLIVMAWANRRVATFALLRNWLIVFIGNFVGARGTAVLVYLGGTHRSGNGAFGVTALAIAHTKVELGFTQAIWLADRDRHGRGRCPELDDGDSSARARARDGPKPPGRPSGDESGGPNGSNPPGS
jgi:formate transporter